MPPKPSLTKFPLSGDVLQTINPWTWWNSAVNQLGGQFGLININTMASGDPALEQNIVQNVASYGRQLGRVADVLNVLIATKGNLAQLTPAQQQQIDAFQQLTEQINAAKKDHPQELSSADTQKFLDRLTALKAANPALYDTLRKKINAAINA
ncbi:MAG: hypothetical protein ACK48P_00535 [Holosporales bacterium]|jgi:hypothetical protein